jgi:hypothetical protein
VKVSRDNSNKAASLHQHILCWSRYWIQGIQGFMQRRIVARVLKSNEQFGIPPFVRFLLKGPILNDLQARFIAFGLRKVHVKNP